MTFDEWLKMHRADWRVSPWFEILIGHNGERAFAEKIWKVAYEAGFNDGINGNNNETSC
jgi:hypothetical protein